MKGPAAPPLTLLLLLCWGMINWCHGATLTDPCSLCSSEEFVKSSCGATSYPRICFMSVSVYASEIQTSPEQLAKTALSLALDSARSAANLAAVASEAAAAGTKNPGDALRDCVELLEDSVEELRQSLETMEHLGGPQLASQISDMQTWVSAALTNDETCTVGLQETGASADDVKISVRESAQMTSNALALIYALVSAASSRSS